MTLLKIALTLFAAGYLGLTAALFFLQRNFIYHPATERVSPSSAGLDGFLEVNIGDWPAISWWRPPQSDADPIILYFHGNAGSLPYNAYELNGIASWGAGVLAVGYPGYGGNDGAPSETGMRAAALANYAWLRDQGFGAERIVIYGHSLGSGVAVDLAATSDAAGLIVSAPFTSMAAMAQKQLPYLPAAVLVRDRYDSLAKMGGVAMPLGWVHGRQDALIPEHMGRKLFDVAAGMKCAHILPNAGHNNVWARGGGAFVRDQAYAFITGAACAR